MRRELAALARPPTRAIEPCTLPEASNFSNPHDKDSVHKGSSRLNLCSGFMASGSGLRIKLNKGLWFT